MCERVSEIFRTCVHLCEIVSVCMAANARNLDAEARAKLSGTANPYYPPMVHANCDNDICVL